MEQSPFILQLLLCRHVAAKPSAPLAAGNPLHHLLLAPSELYPQSRQLMVHDDIEIQFMALWPLHAEEHALLESQGASSLLTQFHREGVTDLVNPSRKPALYGAQHEH